jgi:hypothetical protein
MNHFEERKPKRVDNGNAEQKWLAENKGFLEANHPGMWLALKGGELVGMGKTLTEAREAAKANGVDDPIFDAVRRKEYQNVIIIRQCH